MSLLLRRLRRQKYDGGITILRDYAAKKSEEITRKAVIRFETEPGYQAQVDWKVLGKHLVDGRWQKLYAFVMVFGYSRKPFVIHTASMDMATFLMCHVLSFTYFGGVPEEVLYDNMKTAFIYQAAEENGRSTSTCCLWPGIMDSHPGGVKSGGHRPRGRWNALSTSTTTISGLKENSGRSALMS
jgi:transposase